MAGYIGPHWGWHRLDSHWADLLVAESGIGVGDLVIDVGAGWGALTRRLVASGATVIAVELHPDRARRLRARFEGRPVTVVMADAADLRLPRRPFHVVANPPFAVTAGLLPRLLAPGSRLVSARIVVPRHVAARWAGPDAPGRRRWEQTFSLTLGRAIPQWAFHPPPPRDAVTLVIHRIGSRPHRT